MQNIIVIEDEQSIADTVLHAIKREGYSATWCTQGREGLEEIKKGIYSLIVLDVGLPDINGFEVCKEIRKFSSIPVIFLTARDDEIDTIVGLEIGGDDYMTKPFSPRELGARIKTILRRSSLPPTDTNELPTTPDQPKPSGTLPHRYMETETAAPFGTAPCSPLVIDEDKFQASLHGQRLELTRYEFRLLCQLAKHPGRVFSRDMLMHSVWGDDSPSLDRTVDTHVKSLRAKFRELDAQCDPILTLRGVGYALKEDL